ncbi:hypothetical protein [Candidatus Vampirococcus lugosii]|uniref:Gcp-like domain-containing protein n=1 Tax=Candidatus Vampirococcus lugosii TaxID=2789015 RepID=A0ABS5QKS9_9BACT|nr:hypothetical protein [Candidatus Vampirococcus lugosii]MBS8121831.1 hypothetical protein [Candidatus Vampirococcus lugosii]
MLINISNSKIYIKNEEKKIYLENKDIERTFTKEIVKVFKEKKIKKCFIINGPGSFTGLRTCSLSLNTINLLQNYEIDFFTISKIDLYKIFFNKGLLPKEIFIFIGQRKKCWKYNLENDKYEYFFIEDIGEKEKMNYDENFTMDIDIKNYSINFILNNIGTKIEINNFSKEKIIKANYMIKANTN